MMVSRYAFTRTWGAITAGLGWIVLLGAPIACWFAAASIPNALGRPNPPALVAAAAGVGMLAGILLGGALIVAGQRLRLAVDSVNLQAAMLEQLQQLNALAVHQTDEASGSRFSGLAGE